MKGKVVVITGGNDGIGFETAQALALMGAEVILLCRNETKARLAIDKINVATGESRAQYIIADLLHQDAVRNAVGELRGRVEKIDVLINNAGAVFSEFELTPDGLERTIAINHFAYFLLTGLALDLLLTSGEARVVNVSSDAHYMGKMDIESFTSNKKYSLFTAYRQSKLANVMFTMELAERISGKPITVNSLHPGTVKTTLGNKAGKFISLGWTLATLFSIDAKTGAKTSVYLSSSPEVSGITGKYFDKDQQREPNPIANDATLRKKLWEVSEKFSGISYPE